MMTTDAHVLQVIHPPCCTAIDVHGLRFEADGTIGVRGLCRRCAIYVDMTITDGAIAIDPPHDTRMDDLAKLLERTAIEHALSAEHFIVTRAADRMRMARGSLIRKLLTFGIDVTNARGRRRDLIRATRTPKVLDEY